MPHAPQRPSPPAQVPEDLTAFLRSFGESARTFAQRERRYLELFVSVRIGRMGGQVAVVVLLLLVLNGVLLLASIAGAKAYAAWLGSEVLGYLAMSGTLLVLVAALLLAAPRLRRWVMLRVVNLLHGE